LLSTVAQLARQRGVMVHTHASENNTECEMVEQETGMRNIAYLESVGISGKHVALAHCVHVDSDELNLLSSSGTNVAHCPSSNLKLGSGIAPVKEMLQAGVSVSLGADGAACNNRLDMFTEMRTAALLQKAQHGPEVLPALQTLRLATIEGAKAMGLNNEIGSLEIGKRADLVVLSTSALHLTPAPKDLASAIVYSAQPDDVQTVIIDGRLVLRDRELLTLNEAKVRSDADEQAVELLKRAGVA
ncbi:MAG: amidohydrolase family protein, partial [Acidobacteriota bacterium]|nr:amidohydrolase family protein [Acidobacteriota bacterium]